MNLNHVTIPSLDVAKSIAFYKTIGLHLIVEALPKYARFECPEGDNTFSVHLVDKLPQANQTIVYFETKKLDKEVARLRENGLTFDLLPQINRGYGEKPNSKILTAIQLSYILLVTIEKIRRGGLIDYF